MKVSESVLRRFIREELILLENKVLKRNNRVDEVGIAGLGAAAVGTGLAIKYFKRVIRNRALKSLAIDFIQTSPELFNIDQKSSQMNRRWSMLCKRINESDFEAWQELCERIENFDDKRVVGIKKIPTGLSVHSSSNMIMNYIKNFSPNEARKLFLSGDFKFDKNDLKFLIGTLKFIRSNNYSTPSDDKSYLKKEFQAIDALFSCMITLFVAKYSKSAEKNKEKIGKELSRIFGKEISITPEGLKKICDPRTRNFRGDIARVYTLKSSVSGSLSIEQINDFIKIMTKYRDSIDVRIILPYNTGKLRGIDTAKIQSDILSIRNKWEFLTSITSALSTVKKVASGGSSVAIRVFLEALLKEVGKDEVASSVVEKLIELVDDSNMSEGHFKEFIKFLISVLFN